jgi:hypothetical protein
MRRNNRTITGLATPLKKVLYGKLEKYILIGSMINIRKLYTNNLGKDVLIHSDTKMHLGGYQKIHFRGGWGRAIFKTRQFRNSKFTPAANATRNAPRRSPSWRTAFAGRVCMSYTNKQKKRRSPERRAAFAISTYISCLRNFQQDISSCQFGG